jgi:hypothetical protein
MWNRHLGQRIIIILNISSLSSGPFLNKTEREIWGLIIILYRSSLGWFLLLTDIRPVRSFAYWADGLLQQFWRPYQLLDGLPVSLVGSPSAPAGRGPRATPPSFLDYFTFRPLFLGLFYVSAPLLMRDDLCFAAVPRVCVSPRRPWGIWGGGGGGGPAAAPGGGAGMGGSACLRDDLRCVLHSCRRALAAFIRSFVSFSRCSASRSPLPLLCEVCTVGRV